MKKITYKSTGINKIYDEIEYENKELIVFKCSEGLTRTIKKDKIIKIEDNG